MTAAWKQDYPNIRNYYVYPSLAAAVRMGPKDDEIREAQRTLPRSIPTCGDVHHRRRLRTCRPRVRAISTWPAMQIRGVHEPAGRTGQLRAETRKRGHRARPQAAWFTSAAKNEVALDFGQPVVWKDEAKLASIWMA